MRERRQRHHETRLPQRGQRRGAIGGIEFRFGVQQHVCLLRLSEQAGASEPAVAGDGAGNETADAVGRLAEKSEPGAGQLRDRLGLRFDLRGKRVMLGGVAKQHGRRPAIGQHGGDQNSRITAIVARRRRCGFGCGSAGFERLPDRGET